MRENSIYVWSCFADTNFKFPLNMMYENTITHTMNRKMVILSNNPPIGLLFAIEAAPAPPDKNIRIAVA